MTTIGRRLRPDELTREKERARILASFTMFCVPENERAEILEALDSPAWDWFNDCDGCTAVSEAYWPTRYFPPCLRHDYDYFVGNPIHPTQARFYRLSRRYRMTKARAGVRWIGVYVGWYAFLKWRNMIRNHRRQRAQQEKTP
jgi:hypothetical protein